MANKENEEFFKEMEKTDFCDLVNEYFLYLSSYQNMMTKLKKSYEDLEEYPNRQEAISMNLCHKMRQRSMDLEKFGQIFRKRSIQIRKERRNAK